MLGLLRGDPTPKIANDILRLTMRNGSRRTPVVKTGSYANIASTQINNTLDGAVWGQINQNLKIGWRELQLRPIGSGILSWTGRTCPICAPLHLKKVPKPPTFVSDGL